jgi:hypothetical protein
MSTRSGLRKQRNPNWREAVKLATQRSIESMRNPRLKIERIHRMLRSRNQKRPFQI